MTRPNETGGWSKEAADQSEMTDTGHRGTVESPGFGAGTPSSPTSPARPQDAPHPGAREAAGQARSTMGGSTGEGLPWPGPIGEAQSGGRIMSEMQLQLTTEEKNLLVRLLVKELGDTRVELHHTHFSPEFRGEVKQEEVVLRNLLGKLQQAGGTPPR
jgi:hypothetical protein